MSVIGKRGMGLVLATILAITLPANVLASDNDVA